MMSYRAFEKVTNFGLHMPFVGWLARSLCEGYCRGDLLPG